MSARFRLEPAAGRHVRPALLSMAAAGAALGALCLVAPPSLARLAGVGEAGEGMWLLRLFGVRELCLAWGLGRGALATAPEPGRAITEVLAVSQAGDLLVTLALAVRGGLPVRTAVLTGLSSGSTLAGALYLRRTGFRG